LNECQPYAKGRPLDHKQGERYEYKLDIVHNQGYFSFLTKKEPLVAKKYDPFKAKWVYR